MTKTVFALLLLLPASDIVRPAPGDRVRIRCDGGTVRIAGGDAVRLPNARRVAANVVEIVVTGDADLVVPRAAAVEWVATGKARAEVRDVAALHIDAVGGAVTARNVRGNVDGKTANGNVTVDGAGGLVDLVTGNGIIAAAHVAGGVHVVSINGKTEIACVAGGVDVKDTSGRTTVTDVEGDVDVFTALGRAYYEGALRANRFYRLRTLDGAVTLAYAAGGSGFVARLASDAMHIESDPPLAGKLRRAEVRSGDERARVVLDAVGGRVGLARSAAPRPACR
jgi:hypothetical protein